MNEIDLYADEIRGERIILLDMMRRHVIDNTDVSREELKLQVENIMSIRREAAELMGEEYMQ